MKSGSHLERVLAAGVWAVTAEAGPPKSAAAEVMRRKGIMLKAHCDALNVTDNQTAVVRMSSLAGSLLLAEVGVEPVLQMVVRDRNRLALQSDILGAVALGVRNVLCLAGDHQSLGNHPAAKGVYDIDSTHLVHALKTLRDEHRFMNGEELKGELPLFIGAATNPFGDPLDLHLLRLQSKVNAGADFLQTQAVFDLERFGEWVKRVRDQGLLDRASVLAGVLPMKSARMAQHLQSSVPGLRVPKALVRRMVTATDAREEGVRICLEIIAQLRELRGVHGVHIMAIAWEDVIPRIVEEAGLLPRPSPSRGAEDRPVGA